MPNKIDGMSMDIEQTEKEKLKAVFPQCFAEGKLDIDKLLSLCGEYIDNDFEKYKFEWHGKAESLRLAQKRSTGTLRPCVEESVNFDDTQNLYIEGDNLEVLKLLQTSYYRKVKMIYIDPPYNTGNDFVYADDFADPMARYKEVTQQTTKSNPETMGRYHTNWLNMMYPRLRLAANLLRDDGVIFISIDDNEVTNLRKVCDEVFGEENFRNIIATRRYDKNLNRQFMDNGLMTMNIGLEFVLVYAKSADTKFTPVFKASSDERSTTGYWKGFWNNADRPTMRYEILGYTPESGQWKWKKELAEEAINNYKEYVEKHSKEMTIEQYWEKTGKTKKFLRRNENGKGMNMGVEHWVAPTDGILRNSNWSDLLASKPTGVDIPFDSPKNIEVITELLRLSGVEIDDIILDFFSGSATTAHAVMQLNAEDGGNRRFICVQLPEVCDEKSEAYKAGFKNICEIGKERIRRAGAKILAEAEQANQQVKLGEEEKPLPDVGFKVFKLDTSNIKLWDGTPVAEEDYQIMLDRMNDMIESIKDDRTDMDVVYEIMLKMGVPLTYPVLPLELDGVKAYSVGEDNLLMICLDAGIKTETIEQLADYAPAKIVIAESCFADVSAMRNA
ncbi:MAG: site-specific DNA-methyltransferase, partial [Clostridiales bacterium]|nr:site-specific DNA-methyltransferase [Clostridiales bacterium]